MTILEEASRELTTEFIRGLREGDGCLPEADESINNASRRVVSAMAEEHGECWLGRVNLHDTERGHADQVMWRWNGEPVLNFDAGFVLPAFDEELLQLIMKRDAGPYTTTTVDSVLVTAILERVRALGGRNLVWT